ncbi:unnamed protein product [Hermetia illucens]|uniref:Lamin-B receptor n=1 Tax=Hermetia illucens TaxID=343691 RepID=A0A7R8UX77_HERIL|nr:lamin-B receptor [Hermetia illucens]CAD7088777.1 unnamed protein product [Hermetia illucens]
MDVRRTRGRPTLSASEPPPRARSPRKSPARKSPARRSPARKSPTRRSPARKSPARRSPVRKSPSRKSPARTKSPTTTQKDAPGRLTRKKPTATVPPTSPAGKESAPISKEVKEKVEKKSPVKLTTITRTPISISPLKRDLKESSSIQSVSSSTYSSSTRTTIKTRATLDTIDFGQNQSSDRSGGDLEVSKLTSIASFIRRSISKNPTPTPELSHHSRSVSRSVYEDDDNYSKTEYSDNEQENYEPVRLDPSKTSFTKKSLARQNEVPREFGGAIGAALFLLLVPPTVLYLQYSCNTQACRFKCVNVLNTTLATISNLFDRYATGAYVSFLVLIHLLSSFPFGRVVIIPNDRGTGKYYFNSILASLIVLIGLGVGHYFKYPVGSFIWKNYFKFLILSTLSALSLSLCCYVRARKAPSNQLNPYAKSGNFIIDFFLGREISPKWFGVVDIKLACYRASIIATFVYSLLLISRNVQLPSIPVQEQPLNYVDSAKYIIENIQWDPAALLSSSLLAIYTLDLIFNEHHLASSFDLQQEGVGALLLLRYAVTPFLLSTIPRYIVLNKPITIPIWGYALISTIFLLGLIIKRASSSIKYQYRMNPQQSNLLLLDTVPTFQGRRLLLDKYWGTLRQPNYAGDILSLLAYGAPVAWKFAWPPVLSILLIVVFLVHRAIRVNARNFRRYDSAWSRYCSRARHLLVPKVF